MMPTIRTIPTSTEQYKSLALQGHEDVGAGCIYMKVRRKGKMQDTDGGHVVSKASRRDGRGSPSVVTEHQP